MRKFITRARGAKRPAGQKWGSRRPRDKRARVRTLGCAHSLPHIRGSDTCEAESRRRADKTVTTPGWDVHRVGAGLAASTSLGGQSPESSSSPLQLSFGSVNQRYIRDGCRQGRDRPGNGTGRAPGPAIEPRLPRPRAHPWLDHGEHVRIERWCRRLVEIPARLVAQSIP